MRSEAERSTCVEIFKAIHKADVDMHDSACDVAWEETCASARTAIRDVASMATYSAIFIALEKL